METSSLQERLKAFEANRPMAAIAIRFARPVEGMEVHFWTQVGQSGKIRYTSGNAIRGVFRNGAFWKESDHWGVGEVLAWAPVDNDDPL
jgi:hypothetical protein